MDRFDRRFFLRHAGFAGAALGIQPLAPSAGVAQEIAHDSQPVPSPGRPVKFAVCGMSHDHIYGMIGAIQRGGGVLVAAWGGEQDKLANFKKRFPDVKIVATQDEIVHDPSIELVLSSQIANERAPLGVRCMKPARTSSRTSQALLRWNSWQQSEARLRKRTGSTQSCTASGLRSRPR